MMYQALIFVAALANALATKGYSPNDGSSAPSSALENLMGILSNMLTYADLPTVFNSPVLTGTPQCPTAPVTTDTNQIASTAFVDGYVTALLATILPVGGFSAGQKIQGGRGTTSSDPFTVTFPHAFSGIPVVVATGDAGTIGISVASVSTTGFTVQAAVGLNFQWIAMGA
jgi:hypothetical protein